MKLSNGSITVFGVEVWWNMRSKKTWSLHVGDCSFSIGWGALVPGVGIMASNNTEDWTLVLKMWASLYLTTSSKVAMWLLLGLSTALGEWLTLYVSVLFMPLALIPLAILLGFVADRRNYMGAPMSCVVLWPERLQLSFMSDDNGMGDYYKENGYHVLFGNGFNWSFWFDSLNPVETASTPRAVETCPVDVTMDGQRIGPGILVAERYAITHKPRFGRTKTFQRLALKFKVSTTELAYVPACAGKGENSWDCDDETLDGEVDIYLGEHPGDWDQSPLVHYLQYVADGWERRGQVASKSNVDLGLFKQ